VLVRRLSAVLTLLVLLVLGGGPASAVEPFRLDDEVTDQVGALDGREAEVEDALAQLRDEEDIQLFVVFVSTFDGLDGDSWTEETSQLSGLGGNDALFAVAVDDRFYGYQRPANSAMSDQEVDALFASDVEDALADDDWAGAVIALADGLRGGSGSGVGGLAALIAVAVIAVVAGGFFLASRSRRKRIIASPAQQQEEPDPHEGTPTDQLQFRASSALLDLDEAIKTSELDLDYARAQYGEEAVAGFDAALATSKAELSRAFTLRQELDDDIPEDEPTTRRMLAEILTLTASAAGRLDEQAEAFGQLRDLEHKAPQVLDGIEARIGELRTRVPEEQQRLDTIHRTYRGAAVDSVADNANQARARLDAAEVEAREARAELAAGDSGAAVGDIRAAEDAVAQTVTLLDGIVRLAQDLEAATGRVAAVRAETEKDLAEARSLLGSGDRSGLEPQIARAEAALEAADVALRPGGDGRTDPLAALGQLEEADIALEQALTVARDAQTRARRAAEALDQAIPTAESTIAAAADFINTRRGAVGPQARTRLAEARRHLDLAVSLSGDDAARALREAQQATMMASHALSMAQDDVSRWSGPGGGGFGGGIGGGYRRGGVDVGSLVLGGILGGILSGGGGHGHGGGFGGGGFGGGGFGGGGGGGFGGGRF
jgi:TPM domain